MTVHPLRPATRHRLGRPSPHQQADRPRAHPPPKTPKKAQSFPGPPCDRPRISRISHTFMRLSRRRGQVTHVLLTRSPLIQNQQADPFTVRLACVKHAASVRPEPGSNSPNKTNKNKPQPTTNKQPARTHSQYNSPENQTRPNPTPNKEGPGKPKQNKPQKPHTTKTMRSPQGHGIKNMTHYRVLKQHTHRDLRPGRIPCLPLEGDRTSISRLSFGNQIRIA